MNVIQISAFVENKPGHIGRVLKVLAQSNINIITLTVADTAEFGVLRMILDKPNEAKKVLSENSITAKATDVLALEIEDSPGSLSDTLDAFSDMNINIKYMYAFTEKRNGKAVMIFRFEDIETAKEALVGKGYNIIRNIDIIGDGND